MAFRGGGNRICHSTLISKELTLKRLAQDQNEWQNHGGVLCLARGDGLDDDDSPKALNLLTYFVHILVSIINMTTSVCKIQQSMQKRKLYPICEKKTIGFLGSGGRGRA